MERRERMEECLAKAGRYLVNPKEYEEMPAWLAAIAGQAQGANLLLTDEDGVVRYVMLDARAYDAFSSLCALVAEVLGKDDDGEQASD